MAKGLPIEAQNPIIECAGRADMAMNVNHADFAYYPKTVQHTDKTVIKGDTYMGEATVQELNIMVSRKDVQNGWCYKMKDSGSLINNGGTSLYVNIGSIVKYHNGAWIELYRVNKCIIYEFNEVITQQLYAELANAIDSGIPCFVTEDGHISVLNKLSDGTLKFEYMYIKYSNTTYGCWEVIRVFGQTYKPQTASSSWQHGYDSVITLPRPTGSVTKKLVYDGANKTIKWVNN